MRILGPCIALAVLLAPLSRAQEASAQAECGRAMLVQSEASESLVLAATESLLRFRIPEAEQTLRRLAARPDGPPAAQHLLATSAFLVGLVTDRTEDFDRFLAHADTLGAHLKSVGSSCWSDYMRAETELQRAVTHVKKQQYARGAWHGRAAYKHYSRAASRYDGFYEVYKGLGLMHLGLGSLPGTWRRFLSILGYKGSVEQGLRELQLAARRSVINRDAAALSLGLAQRVLGLDEAAGLSILKEVHERHPESPFFGYLYGYALLENRDASEAEAVLSRYARQEGDRTHHYINYVDYFLGRALFLQDRFEEAENRFRRYLNQHQGPSLKGSARLSLGLALEMQGKRREAIAQYENVEIARSYDGDEAAKREANRRIEKPLEGASRQLLLAANAYDSGRYERAHTLLQAVLADPTAEGEEKVEAAYRLGRTRQAEGDLGGAMEAYLYVLQQARDPEAKWAPWAQYYIGEIHRDRNEQMAAKNAFQAALQYRGPFDYDESLEQNARAALERLRSGD